MSKIKTLTEIQNETGLSKTNTEQSNVDYITEESVNDLRKYIAQCIKKLNKGVRLNLRNAILRRIEFLEWRYEE